MARSLSETETGVHGCSTPCASPGHPARRSGCSGGPVTLALAEPAPEPSPAGSRPPAFHPLRPRRRPRTRPASPSARRLLAGRLVMVVEDEEDARRITRTMLEYHGASVVTASDAGDALLRLLTVCPDVMVLDLRMPGMDGFQLVRHLRADPHWQHLPIVALSALGGDADYQRTFQDGFDAHLTKPVDDGVLASVVLRVMQR